MKIQEIIKALEDHVDEIESRGPRGRSKLELDAIAGSVLFELARIRWNF